MSSRWGLIRARCSRSTHPADPATWLLRAFQVRVAEQVCAPRAEHAPSPDTAPICALIAAEIAKIDSLETNDSLFAPESQRRAPRNVFRRTIHILAYVYVNSKLKVDQLKYQLRGDGGARDGGP
jgi:hypothetical protein